MDQISILVNNLLKTLIVFILFLSLQFQTAAKEINYLINPPCSKPITYKIGEVDSRFNISRDEFQKRTEEATYIWENPIGRNLFAYDPSGKLTVNLIFDNRQLISNQISNLEENLQNQKESINPQVQTYKNEVANFNKRVEELNKEIEYWNNQGGASQDVYDKIKKQEEELKAEAQRLSNVASSLNQLSTNFNVTVKELNQTIGSFNEELSKKPEEGVYDPEREAIDIYFSKDKNELMHTLAHEFGHSLSLNHIANPKAIMYANSTKTVQATSEDLNVLKTACRIKSS